MPPFQNTRYQAVISQYSNGRVFSPFFFKFQIPLSKFSLICRLLTASQGMVSKSPLRKATGQPFVRYCLQGQCHEMGSFSANMDSSDVF